MRIMLYTATTLFVAAMMSATPIGGKLQRKTGPSLSGANNWLNSQPLTLESLRGKVVLIDFWTYTCINWRRTLPYIRAWETKYKDQGLVVIGVHTPEFSFEQKSDNVVWAIHDMHIGYPVAIDNQYDIWRSFENNYWPALYLSDAKGKIKYQKFGEGDYAEIELQIQRLLKETSANNVSDTPVVVQPEGFEVAADWENLQSPENYIGYERSEGFASVKGAIPDKPVLYSVTRLLKLNEWGLSGEWIMGKENARLNKAPGKMIYRFHARDMNLIMGPASPGGPLRFRVLIDGRAPGSSHGMDVDSNGNGEVKEQRMYQLIRQPGKITDREIQIEFVDEGVEVYDFTFG